MLMEISIKYCIHHNDFQIMQGNKIPVPERPETYGYVVVPQKQIAELGCDFHMS